MPDSNQPKKYINLSNSSSTTVIDNLDSDSENLPLSAKQGKNLNGMIEWLKRTIKAIYVKNSIGSTDKWIQRTLPVNVSWISLCWSPELRIFCAIAGSGTIALTSPDGITWTQRTLPTIGNWRSVCWSPSLQIFCAIGDNWATATSPDGITWIPGTLPQTGNTGNWYAMCWSPSLQIFYAVESGGNNGASSSDGITWTLHGIHNDPSTIRNYRNICWSSDLGAFCMISIESGSFISAISSDGITWTSNLTETPYNNVTSLCWSSDLRIFCATIGNQDKIAISSDGLNWIFKSLPSIANYQSICYSSELGVFCAVTSGNDNIGLTSTSLLL